MPLSKPILATLLALSLAPLSGCSSDEPPLPMADLDIPGTFVAVNGYEAPNQIALLRILDRLHLENDRLLFLTQYDVDPKSFEEAREIAKNHQLPTRQLIRIEPDRVVTDHPYEIVWFRTLTKEEEDRAK